MFISKEGIGTDPVDSLHEDLGEWFSKNIGTPTDLQMRSWSAIKEGRNVLVISPTGSGKTLSAVIPAVDDILKGKSERSATSILYVTPMKALGADMMRTLEELSKGIGRIPGKKERRRGRRRGDSSLPDAFLDVGIRTGDVPQSKRRKMLVDPPDLLLVTPENLLLMACSKARETLDRIRYVIIDEVHEMVGSKRGALLSLTVEYLVKRARERTGREPQRIGLSATVKPERVAAKYLGGIGIDSRLRDVSLVKHDSKKEIEVAIKTLFDGIYPDEMIREKVLKDIGTGIQEETDSVVVFHNTRKQAEEMAYALTGRGIEGVLPHHGSLGPDVRREAEEGLKEGKLKAIISSTSLELGIDIGRVGTIYQVSSPKDPGKLLQRLGRSGHGLGRISKGTIYPTGAMDLLECLGVSLAASRGELENLIAQEAPMDVLAQFIIGLTLVEGGAKSSDIWKLFRSAYPYRNLKKKTLNELILLLHERLPGPTQPPPRLWMDDEGQLHPRRNTRQAFYLNCGTIPKETTFKVIEKSKRRVIGTLSRDFGEALYERDVILLGSKSFRVSGFKGQAVLVKEDPDAQPTVPRWSGEVNPRPTMISDHIYNLLGRGTGRVKSGLDREVRVYLDENGRNSIEKLRSHLKEKDLIPRSDLIPVEVIEKGRERRYYIFHLPLGRRVTEPMGRALSYGLRKNLGAMVDHTATDDGFAISTPAALTEEQIIEGIGGDDHERIAYELILSSSMYRTRFSQILAKSLLVLTRFRGKDTSAIYRRNRVSSILDMLMKQYYSEEGWVGSKGPMAGLILLGREAIQEVLREKMDLPASKKIAVDLMEGRTLMKIGSAGKKASITGSSIISTWTRSRKRKEEKVGPVEKEVSDQEAFDMGSVRASKDPLKESLVSTVGAGTELNDKEGNFVKAPMFVTNIERSKTNSLSLTEEEVKRIRTISTLKGEKISSVLKSLPFFSHPIEVMSRSRRTDLNSLRSLVKGGKIVPFRVMGSDRMMDKSWEEIFISLTPFPEHIPPPLIERVKERGSIDRSEMGSICGMKGDELTELIESCFASGILRSYPEEGRFHLGAFGGMFTLDGDPFEKKNPENQLKALTEFLKRVGPFTMEELSKLFSWPEGKVPTGLMKGLGDGDLVAGLGPDPLMNGTNKGGSEGIESIWIWNGEKDPKIYFKKFAPADLSLLENDGPFRNSDPVLSLTGMDQGWVEKEKVRSTITSQYWITDREGERASWTVLEGMDLISVRSLEIEEYSRLEELVKRASESIMDYSRLGYRVIKIEKIMGVPSGEAASKAQQPFLENTFKNMSTTKGSILILSPPVKREVRSSDVLKTMLVHQKLYPGSHLNHPLQAVEMLGGIADRWELLSRIGAKRNSRLSDSDTSRVESHIERYWRVLLSKVMDGKEPELEGWDPLLLPSFEEISELKDLSKRFGLHRGMMDQPSPVWSFRRELERFMKMDKVESYRLPERYLQLMDMASSKTVEEWNNSLRIKGSAKDGQSLIEYGLALEDPWGTIIPMRAPSRKSKNGSKGIIKGVVQRAQIMRCAHALGAFSMENLLDYAPCLGDVPKVRMMLNDLCKGPLKIAFDKDSEGDLIYLTEDPPAGELIDTSEEEDYIIISPRDRMWRVLSSLLRGIMTRGKGYLVLKGSRPVAHLIMRKMAKSPRKDEEYDTGPSRMKKEYWMIKKAWLDPRIPRNSLMRAIRKRFFDLGVEIMSMDEKLKIEDLYREMDSREENILA